MRMNPGVTLQPLHILSIVVAGWCAALGDPAAAGDANTPRAAPGAKHSAPAPRHRAQFGIASVYARTLDGRTTASGETHESDEFTAAHRTLPLGTTVRVTNLSNHRSTVVRINDRGPQVKSRIIDLSPRAAAAIGLRAHGKGVTRVRVDVVAEPPPVKEANADTAAHTEKPPGGHEGEGARPAAGQ
jgi:rare lipoprotein A